MMIVFNKIDAYTYIQKDEDDLTPRTKENLTLEEPDEDVDGETGRQLHLYFGP